MDTVSHEEKTRLSERISKIDKKDDYIQVLKIINDNNKDMFEHMTENSNGIFMFFHKFSNITYIKLKKYLDNLDNLNNLNDSKIGQKPEKQEYVPYEKSEFPIQDGISPKLKYSNREKNIIRKKKKYDKEMKNSESDTLFLDDLNTSDKIPNQTPKN